MLNDLKRIGLIFLTALILLAGSTAIPWAVKNIGAYEIARSLASCKALASDDEQVECIFHSIDSAIEKGNLKQGFSIFAGAYRNFTSFSSTGCHRHAHRVGDSVYYRYYILGHDTLDDIDFPQEATACGYGLFHGFLEHLIQDRPDPEFAMGVCEALDEKLSDTMKDIRVVCYHGTGHGYTLAHAETLSRDVWGNMNAFTEFPLSQCNEMTRATESEKEDCRQGVFNVVADWMEEKNYGFAYNTSDPFESCRAVPSNVQYSCYYEMAQKIGNIARNDPVALYAIAGTAETQEFADLAFVVGIAGVIQQVIANEDGYLPVLERCGTLSDGVFHRCVESIVWGLYEHGSPQIEYKEVLSLCREPVIQEHGETDFCYEKAADRLSRFYTAEHIKSICAEFPEAYATRCEKEIK